MAMTGSMDQQTSKVGTSIRILIVEDEALEAFLLKNCLNLEGYEVCELASSGQEAVDIAGREHPDMIVMDHGLNGNMNGFDAAKEIRRFLDVPVLFLTGFIDDDFITQMKNFSPADGLMKPCRIPDVLAKIQELLYPPT